MKYNTLLIHTIVLSVVVFLLGRMWGVYIVEPEVEYKTVFMNPAIVGECFHPKNDHHYYPNEFILITKIEYDMYRYNRLGERCGYDHGPCVYIVINSGSVRGDALHKIIIQNPYTGELEHVKCP